MTEAVLPSAIAIVGPTAAGKSALGMQVAQRFGLPIICCDSVQVFRGLDIGSAKPGAEERGLVDHQMLDLVDPDAVFSVADYARGAHEVLSKGPGLIVGGTGFYLRGATWTHSGEDDAPPDDPRRLAFEREWSGREEQESGSTHRALAAIDPEAAAQIHPRNFVRTLRALWLCEQAGEPVSSVRKRDPPQRRLDLLTVVIDPGQAALDPAITRRCDEMLARGWVTEVEKLKQAGYDARFKAMRSLGYKQLLEHLDGETTLREAREQIVRSTRQYARRQRTFFRHQLGDQRVFRIEAPEQFPWREVEGFVSGGEGPAR